jgi:hypothetical protein
MQRGPPVRPPSINLAATAAAANAVESLFALAEAEGLAAVEAAVAAETVIPLAPEAGAAPATTAEPDA